MIRAVVDIIHPITACALYYCLAVYRSLSIMYIKIFLEQLDDVEITKKVISEKYIAHIICLFIYTLYLLLNKWRYF